MLSFLQTTKELRPLILSFMLGIYWPKGMGKSLLSKAVLG